MELELKQWIERSKEERDPAEAAIKKAVEAAVHLHGGMPVDELVREVGTALRRELAQAGLYDEKRLQFAFVALIEAIRRPKEKETERLLTEIDRLHRQLHREREELQRSLRELFSTIETMGETLESDLRTTWVEALESTELGYVESLGLLNETVESALVAALEEADDIEEAVRTVVRQITLETVGEGILSAPRLRTILTTILSRASDLAEATPNRAREILHGTVYGINDALIATVSQLKEQLAFAPEELKSSGVLNWNEMVKMLARSDELYKEIIDNVAAKNSPFVAEILRDSLKQPKIRFAELRNLSHETLELAKQKLSTLAKEAVQKSAELTIEARKLGRKAWQKALEMAESYKKRR